ncbi:MAG: hypothetical protein PsegKO_26770 [Pseudohongiellaceae bacterium]
METLSALSTLAGIGLGFAIGIGCRLLDLPLPAPPRLVGALLVVTITSGFILTGVIIG